MNTLNHYVDRHKDDEQNDSGYRVIRVSQEWVRGFPTNDKRAPILTGLTRDEAQIVARMFDQEKRSIAADVAARIEFLTDNETNQETAERPDLDCPLIF